MTPEEATAITEELHRLIASVAPAAQGRRMYGGTVFEMTAGVPSTAFCGTFARKSHVSLEFLNGAGLTDPHGLLEGSGTSRRHLKLRSLADLEARHAREFLAQAAVRSA